MFLATAVKQTTQHLNLACPSYPLTDCGNAERLVEQHGEGIRFCREMKSWLVWDGCRWVANCGAAVELAKKTVRSLHHERNQIVSHAERCDGWEILRQRADALTRWEMRSESAARITAMLHLAKSDPRVSVSSQNLDRNSWVLNVPNGTVDLRYARLREHRPEELLTKIAGAEYRADAKCPRWKQFLGEVFEPHPDLIPFVQRAVGYTLTGDARCECVFVLVGSGRNGKSTLIGVLDELLGEYAGIAEIETFLTSRGNPLREDIADMRGRRLVSAQEPSMTGALAEATLKWLSGGDRLRARRLYEHTQEFHPSHKLWLAVNRLPTIRSDDRAARARLRVIPFDVSFERRPDRELKSQLSSELSGILRWALEGCLHWRREGLNPPPIVMDVAQLERPGRRKAA